MNFEQRSKLVNQLAARKQKGAKEVIKKLTSEQREFVEEVLQYTTIPYIYEITTQRIANVANSPGILKEVDRRNRAGKRKIYKQLRQRDRQALDRANISYRALKFRILLEEKA